MDYDLVCFLLESKCCETSVEDLDCDYPLLLFEFLDLPVSLPLCSSSVRFALASEPVSNRSRSGITLLDAAFSSYALLLLAEARPYEDVSYDRFFSETASFPTVSLLLGLICGGTLGTLSSYAAGYLSGDW